MLYPLEEQGSLQCYFITLYKCELCFMKTIYPAIDLHVLTSFVNRITVN